MTRVHTWPSVEAEITPTYNSVANMLEMFLLNRQILSYLIPVLHCAFVLNSTGKTREKLK